MKTLLVRLVALVGGLVLFGFGTSLMVRAHIGVEPWSALGLGVAQHTGLSFGLVTNLIGAAVLALWLPLRQRPGLGTLLNIVLIGTAAQLGLAVLPVVPALAVRVPLFAAGLLLVAVGSGLYLGAGFGAGPRDGLMTGLHRRFGVPLWLGRTAVEVSVALAGWLLGGDIGAGTVAFALLIGPLCNRTVPWFTARIPSPRGASRSGAARLNAGSGRPPGSPRRARSREASAPARAPRRQATIAADRPPRAAESRPTRRFRRWVRAAASRR